MKNDNYTPPKFKEDSFNCPYCNAYAYQDWFNLCYRMPEKYHYLLDEFNDQSQASICSKCKKSAIWSGRGKMLVPIRGTAPLAAENMPEDVKEIFEEARQVQPFSPRGAAALLRVCLEKLCAHLGEGKGTLNEKIKRLKEKGLPEKVIQSLDIIRINANEGGSHAGLIDLTGEDNTEIVDKLFFLVNFIVEKTITEPKEIENAFERLPSNKKDGIANRDSGQQ